MGGFRKKSIAIVDPAVRVYDRFNLSRGGGTIDFCLLRSGEEAIGQFAPTQPAAWLIHEQLPDMTGLELHSLLRLQRTRVPAFLIADRYDSRLEAEVLGRGSLHLVCKPLSGNWLHWLCRSLGTAPAGRRRSRTARLASVAASFDLCVPTS